ncbi:MAG: tetratricopeptide repeat protein [Candidatus Latescibacterota bacterium]|nr:tetratricopeptide repeat protein [Candidatus Latescibacterota bacterium]
MRILLSALTALTVLVTSSTSAQEEVSVADSVRKYRFLGRTARDNKSHEAVVGYYQQLLRYKTDDYKPHYYIGRAQLALRQSEAAKQAFLQALEVNPRHANSILLLFQIYLKQEKADSAWTFLRPMVRAKPMDTKFQRYRRNIADLQRRQGHAQPAIAHYQALIDSGALGDNVNRGLVELLAVMHRDKGDAAIALQWQHRLLSEGGSEVEILGQMVDLQIATGDTVSAFKTLKKLARVDSAGSFSHFHRMSELGDTHNSSAMRLAGLEGIARLQPDDANAVATLAEHYLKTGDGEVARRWVDRGLQSNPEYAHLHIIDGDLLQAAGDEVAAVAAYQRAKSDPNWEAVAQQRVWQIYPPETEEERLKRAFFGGEGHP